MTDEEVQKLEEAKIKARIARMKKIDPEGSEALMEFFRDDLTRADGLVSRLADGRTWDALAEIVGERKYIRRVLRFLETYLGQKETSGDSPAS